MIRAVVFDFGNVICRFDNRIILKNIAERTGKSVEELEECISNSGNLIAEYEKGLLSSAEFFNRLASLCDVRMSMNEFVRSYTDKFTPIEETFALIRRLKGRYRLGLLSNTSELDFEHGIRPIDIFPLFDAVTLSFQIHALKPAKQLFLDIVGKLGVPTHECVYIDDIRENVEAATEIGMHAIHFRTSQRLTTSLQDLQLL